MGPERRNELRNPDPLERETQELEALLAESGRLLAEMDQLMSEARTLVARTTRNLGASARRRKRRRPTRSSG